LIEINEFNKAIECFNKCLELNSSEPIYYSFIAKCYIGLKNYLQAIEYLNKTLEINPNCYHSHFGKGKIIIFYFNYLLNI
jgi:tetratricopeptide (TPR) repeat protein